MSDKEQNRPDEASIARLLHAAGRGPIASEEARERIYRSVHSEWRREIGGARTKRFWQRSATPWLLRGIPIAATASLAVVVIYLARAPGPALGAELATVSRSVGVATLIAAANGTVSPLDGGAIVVRAGDTVTTGQDGAASLDFANGVNLRISSNSEISMASDDSVALRRGRIYIDSGIAAGSASALEIDTPFGTVWHRGTQYETRVGANNLRIRVREGAVAFRDDGDADREYLSAAGEQLLISENADEPSRSPVATTGPDWAWVENLASAPRADRYPIIEILEWIARQTGRQLDFASDSAADSARSDSIVGVAGLNPTETLAVIASTTALRYELTQTDLVIF